MAKWKKVASKEKSESVQHFLAALHRENNKIDFADLSLAIISLGVGTVAHSFAKYIAPKRANLLSVTGIGLSVVGLTTLFLANPNSARLQTVLDDCAKYNGLFIKTVTEVWEYVGWSGNNITWETRTNYYWY